MRKKRVSKVLAVTLSTSLAVTYLIALVGGYSVSAEQLLLRDKQSQRFRLQLFLLLQAVRLTPKKWRPSRTITLGKA